MVAVTFRTNLTCGRTANDLHADKQIPHFRGQNIEIKIDRAKEHDQRHILLDDRGVKLAHCIAGISRARREPFGYGRAPHRFLRRLSAPLNTIRTERSRH
jgi:hypothetical protein